MPAAKETALLELSKKRESFPELAPYLWHSFGTMAALLQEIVSIYPMLQPPSLTAHASNRVCNALALLQCVASHPETRLLFLQGGCCRLGGRGGGAKEEQQQQRQLETAAAGVASPCECHHFASAHASASSPASSPAAPHSARHPPSTRAAHIPLFLYPFLNTISKTRPFEYLRLTSLGVIGALVKVREGGASAGYRRRRRPCMLPPAARCTSRLLARHAPPHLFSLTLAPACQVDDTEVINFLLSTEIIPLCLRTMETGSELSKTVATFIVQKILLDNVRRAGGGQGAGGGASRASRGAPRGEAQDCGACFAVACLQTSLDALLPPALAPCRRAGWAELHLRHRRALLCCGCSAEQHGDRAGGAAQRAPAQAHCAVLPAAQRQPTRAGGAAPVPPRPAAQPCLHRLPEGRWHSRVGLLGPGACRQHAPVAG